MKIAFHDNCLSLRGTTVAIYDWAYWTRHYLSIDPIIMYDENHPANSIDAINKFKKEFSVFSYFNKSQIDKILLENQCDAFFMIKGGSPDGVISSVSKNFVNAVSGHWKPNWIHGDVYAMGSKWLSKITNNVIPNVPHMVCLPDVDEDMREELGIPKDALVIGRNGGSDTFDIPFVKQAIQVVLNERKDIWFVFN